MCSASSGKVTPQYSRPGPPRTGLDPSEENFSCLVTRVDWLKICMVNRNDWLSVAGWLGLGLKWLICKSTNNTTEKDRNICNINGLLTPFWTASPGNLYWLSPHLIVTVVTQNSPGGHLCSSTSILLTKDCKATAYEQGSAMFDLCL